MKIQYPKWQGQLENINQSQATFFSRAFKSLSGFVLTILTAYITVLLIHWPGSAQLVAESSNLVIKEESMSDGC